jgi:hypothetical protein
MQSTTFNEGQSETVIATPNGLLASGNVPTWSVNPNSPQTGLALTPAANGLSAVVAGSVPATYQVDVAAQNSAGGNFITSFQVIVNALAATSFTFTFGSPS